jgi:uncharacterized membrane protein
METSRLTVPEALPAAGPGDDMHARTMLALAAAAALLAALWTAADAQPQDKGAAEIVLEGGTSGNVHFPHQQHQQALADCSTCHSAYPQKAGAIEELKAQGKLEKKEIMNTQCTKCHKERKRAGEKGGPTTCTTCHVKG